jgi:MFS family permease
LSKLVDTLNEPVTVHPPSLWLNRNFVMIWSGMSISNLTFQFYMIALPLIIVDETRSSLGTGIMRAVEFLPNLLLAAVLGVLVDRFNRKSVMRLALWGQMAVLAILLALILTHADHPWELYILAFFIGSAGYAFGNAYHSTLPLIVAKQQLTSANASLSFINSLINVTGPAVAGVILAVSSYSVGITGTICGLFILLCMVQMTRIPSHGQARQQKKDGFWSELKEGWRELVSNDALWVMTLMILLLNLASAVSGAVMLFYARDHLHATTAQVGMIYAAIAIGTMLASLAAKRSRRWAGRGTLMLCSVFVSIIGQLIMFLAVKWYVIAMGMFCMGFSAGFINIHYFTLRQESTPNHLLGRVAGTSSMIMKLASPLAYVVSGAIGTLIPVNYMFLISACMCVPITIFGLRRGLHRYA